MHFSLVEVCFLWLRVFIPSTRVLICVLVWLISACFCAELFYALYLQLPWSARVSRGLYFSPCVGHDRACWAQGLCFCCSMGFWGEPGRGATSASLRSWLIVPALQVNSTPTASHMLCVYMWASCRPACLALHQLNILLRGGIGVELRSLPLLG
jgi:hypothetical protein